MKVFLGAGFLCLAAPLANAQDLLGTIQGTVGDQPYTWHLTAQNGESQSAHSQVMKGLDDISLWGHATADSTSSVKGALLLDFNVMSIGNTLAVTDATLQFLQDGYKSGYLADDASPVQVTLTTFEVSDAGVRIEGSFGANANYSSDIMRQITDPAQTVTINGSFSATLPAS